MKSYYPSLMESKIFMLSIGWVVLALIRSYIGSSMKAYYSMHSSEASRYDNHFNHANNFRSSISHKCKQP